MTKEKIIKYVLIIVVLFNGISLLGYSVNNGSIGYKELILFGLSSMILGAQIKSFKI